MTREISELRKKGENIGGALEEAKQLPAKIDDSDAKLRAVEERSRQFSAASRTSSTKAFQ